MVTRGAGHVKRPGHAETDAQEADIDVRAATLSARSARTVADGVKWRHSTRGSQLSWWCAQSRRARCVRAGALACERFQAVFGRRALPRAGIAGSGYSWAYSLAGCAVGVERFEAILASCQVFRRTSDDGAASVGR